MEKLKCFICKVDVLNGLNGLVIHFKSVHGLTLNRGLGHAGFECGQQSCMKRFSRFDSFRKHIRKRHLPTVSVELPTEDDADGDDNEETLNLNGEYPVGGDGGPANDPNDDPGNNHNGVDGFPHNHDEFGKFDLRSSVIRMIARLHSKNSVTGTVVTAVLDECKELLSDTVHYLKYTVTQYFDQRNMINTLPVQDLLTKFDFDCPFEGLTTLQQQMNAIKNQRNYVEPLEIRLGERVDTVLDSKTGTYIPKLVTESFQYVPVIDVLSLVLQNKDIKESILSEVPSENGVIASFIDGEHFKNHVFYRRYPHALRLEVYYDDLEIVNPLGSKTGPHKLGAFLMRIQNVPEHINSVLGSIHTLCLCYSADVKKYGFQRILQPFLVDLEKLESDNGVIIKLHDEEFTLRASVAAFCGDGLAVHEVFGLLSPSSRRFCRMCLISRQELHSGNIDPREERTEEMLAQHLHAIRTAGPNKNDIQAIITDTGVRENCPLNTSRYFHTSRNKVFDILHDIFLGVGPMVLKLVLHHYIFEERIFDVDYLNGQISCFKYGRMEQKNKPSANFSEARLRNINDHTLSQKGMQCWCLLRSFPFLVAEKVPIGDEYMNLILLLLRVMEIALAPKITLSILPYLNELINSFCEVFKTLFPNKNFINKFHHMKHYAECIKWSGPLSKLWCMRYEGNHGATKQRAQVVCNFKNCPKTLIRVSQSVQSSMWGGGDVKLHSVKSLGGKIIEVARTLSERELRNIGYMENSLVLQTMCVLVNGTTYAVGTFVCLDVKGEIDVNMPIFGKISEIIIIEGSIVYLHITIYTTLNLDPDFNAYAIESENERNITFLQIQDLAFYRPFSAWTHLNSDKQFISLRHILL